MKCITMAGQAILCLFFFQIPTASASEHWQVCDNCSTAARQSLATQFPPNQFGSTLVNVLDRHQNGMSSFRVSVFYDFEFRQFFRFAMPVSASVDSINQFTAWRDFDATMSSLGEEALETGIGSAATWIAQPSAAGEQVLNQIQQSGLQDLLHAMGSLAPLALGSDISVLTRFRDDSTGRVNLFVNDQTGLLSVTSSMSRALSPSGRLLPVDLPGLVRLDQIGDSADTEYLRRHISTAWQNARWIRDAREQAEQPFHIYCQPGSAGAVNCYSVGVT